MTGHPSSGWGEGSDVAPINPELARLRLFCLLNGVLLFCFGVMLAVLRLLGVFLFDVPVAAPLLAQEMLCAVSMVVLAVQLLRARGPIARDPAVPGSAARAARRTRTVALVIAAICAAGMLVVLLLPIAESAALTVMLTVFVIVFGYLTDVAMAKASR
ncbi:MAG: hypothetical protein ACRDSL_23105 [Pseudonocardiaceae bacterium]